jgi:cellulose synthase/poly-beta-1,6-N-acetylglucosamine synthase-like glycosyltransferase
LALLQVPLLAVWLWLAVYLVFLTASALVARVRERKPQLDKIAPQTHFSVLVPAHDEELVIGECLDSLMAFDYPQEMKRVIVIADNCSDETANIAASKGAIVYERNDMSKRGKGYALDWAMHRLLKEDGGWTSAVLVFDADTQADPRFLRHMDERLQSGSLALQGRYDLHNPFDNWRTALLYSALLLHNRLRPLARQALGWTTLLKGNGMCFARPVVERFGWNTYGLAEDIEYTTGLLNAGIRVESVPGAVLYAQAPQTSKQADSQRMRWEGGRLAAARRDGIAMLRDFLKHRSAVKLDWAMDLLTPPVGILVGVPVLMLMVNVPLALLWPGVLGWVAGAWALALLGATIYVLGGLMISGAERRAYLYLLATPIFLVWKMRIYAAMLLGKGPRGWVRTERTTMS